MYEKLIFVLTEVPVQLKLQTKGPGGPSSIVFSGPKDAPKTISIVVKIGFQTPKK